MKYPPLQDPESPPPGPASGPPAPDPERDPSPGGDEQRSSGRGPVPDAGASATGTSGADTAREGTAAPPPGDPGDGPSDTGADAAANTPIYAGSQMAEDEVHGFDDDGIAGSSVDDSDDDEFAELIERVDLDELEDLDDDDAVEVPTLTDEPAPEPRPAHASDPPAGDAGAIGARHRIGGDEPIPMLTEVVQVPRYDTEDLPQSLAEVDWGDLAQRVRENVLERLLRRSDALLDAQLQDTLVPVLERAAETVAHELHDALNRMIRDIVARAVTEELTRLHAEIAKRNRSRPH